MTVRRACQRLVAGARLSERDEQMRIAEYLDFKGLVWNHPPNEGQHKPQYMHIRRLLGVKPGVPDVMIYDIPPLCPDARGCAIELKSTTKTARLSAEQSLWLELLEQRKWITAVCYGHEAAIEWLHKLGW